MDAARRRKAVPILATSRALGALRLSNKSQVDGLQLFHCIGQLLPALPGYQKWFVSCRKPLIFPEAEISPLSCSQKFISVFKPPSSRLRSKFFGRTATSQSGQPLKELAR